jgi:hypothetical protein
VDIQVTVERAGRSITTTSARLLQEGRVLQVANAVNSMPRPGLTYDEYVRPRDADPGDAPRFGPPAVLATSRTPMYDSTPTSSRSTEATKRW